MASTVILKQPSTESSPTLSQLVVPIAQFTLFFFLNQKFTHQTPIDTHKSCFRYSSLYQLVVFGMPQNKVAQTQFLAALVWEQFQTETLIDHTKKRRKKEEENNNSIDDINWKNDDKTRKQLGRNDNNVDIRQYLLQTTSTNNYDKSSSNNIST